MVQLAIAYGKFMKSHRNATEDPVITDILIGCLRVFSSEDMDFDTFEWLIADWSFYVRKQRIFRAAKRVLNVLQTYFRDNSSTTIQMRIQSSAQLPAKEDLDQANRITDLIQRSLLLSAQWQAESNEDPEECYGTNSELAILRLVCINPAVTYDRQEDTYMGRPFYGIPASKIEMLLQSGLLDDRGHPLTDLTNNTPNNNQ